MELDELKTAWQSLDRRLEQQTALNLHLLKERKLEKTQHGLRPLIWGQAIQIAFGALLALASGSFWVDHRHIPHLLIAGVVMHLYGIAMIVFGARMQHLIHQIDFGAPVVEIQQRLALLRRFYVRGGLWIGLPWWVLWVPLAMMLFMGAFGADLYARIPRVVNLNLVVGLLGWALTLLFAAWVKRFPRFAERLERALAGTSLNKVQQRLNEIDAFTKEHGHPGL
jgi:hypothetical protein